MGGPMGYIAGGGQVFGLQAERHLKICKERIEGVRRLTDALFDYLTFHERMSVATADEKPPDLYKPSLEDFNRAQENREAIQSQVQMLEEQIEKLEKSGNEELSAMMRAGGLFPLQMQLKSADEWLAQLQTAMES